MNEEYEQDFEYYGKIFWLCDVYSTAADPEHLLLCLPIDPREKIWGNDGPEVINGAYKLREEKDGSLRIPGTLDPVVHMGQIFYEGNYTKTLQLFQKGARATSTTCACCQHVKYHNTDPKEIECQTS